MSRHSVTSVFELNGAEKKIDRIKQTNVIRKWIQLIRVNDKSTSRSALRKFSEQLKVQLFIDFSHGSISIIVTKIGWSFGLFIHAFDKTWKVLMYRIKSKCKTMINDDKQETHKITSWNIHVHACNYELFEKAKPTFRHKNMDHVSI